jgi:hypothetical protein
VKKIEKCKLSIKYVLWYILDLLNANANCFRIAKGTKVGRTKIILHSQEVWGGCGEEQWNVCPTELF